MQNNTVHLQRFTTLKSCLLLSFFFFATHIADAQQSVGVPSNTIDVQQGSNTLQEKLFVHTDKNAYVAGELVWLKLYNLQADTHLPALISKVAYVEVLDANNKPLLQQKIALDSGLGNGALQLPLEIETGNYQLRAYTSWMKNCGASCFFQKNISIVNTLKTAVNIVKSSDTAFAITFFPEGGNLVSGVENKVAYKATDVLGKGIQFSGVIVNDRGDTVANIASVHKGMGSFTFTPEDNQDYKAVIALPNGSYKTQPLPQPSTKGYAVQLTKAEGSKLKITVQQKGTGTDGTVVYLAATTNEQVKAATQTNFNNNSAVLYVDADMLGAGVSRLTLFDNNRQPIAERLYFKKPERKMQVEAAANAVTYDSRKKVELSIAAKDEKGEPLKADLSMAVYLVDELQQWGDQNISDYLWIGSDLKGNIEAPEFYLQATGPEAEAAADLLMLTHGWRRFSNNENNSTKAKISFSHDMEYDGHIVKGIVRNVQTGQPAEGIQAYLSVPGSNLQFYTSNSDKDGLVQFNVKNYYGPGVVVLQTNTEKDSLYQVQLLNPFSESFEAVRSYSLPLAAHLENSLVKSSIGMQVQNVYHADSIMRVFLQQRDSLPFYGTPNNSYLLDDYTRFTTMEEVLREYVREINVRKRGGQYQMIVYNEAEQLFFYENSLIIVDGVPLFNQSSLFSYSPLKVRKLDVLTRRYFIGNLTFNGIASFTTHNGNFDGLALNPRAVIIDYEGLQQRREFYAPQYETEEQQLSRLPDFRNTLHWVPTLKQNGAGSQQVSFYTSDQKGKYKVVIQGISKDGRSGATTFTFDVQ